MGPWRAVEPFHYAAVFEVRPILDVSIRENPAFEYLLQRLQSVESPSFIVACYCYPLCRRQSAGMSVYGFHSGLVSRLLSEINRKRQSFFVLFDEGDVIAESPLLSLTLNPAEKSSVLSRFRFIS